jgi:hypothetical protein
MFDSPHVFEPLLNSEQAAAIVKVHPKTLQRYARNGIVGDYGLVNSGVSGSRIFTASCSVRSNLQSTLKQNRGTLFLTTRARNQAGGKPCLFGHGISMEVFG